MELKPDHACEQKEHLFVDSWPCPFFTILYTDMIINIYDYVYEYGISVFLKRWARHRRSAIEPLGSFDPGGYHMLQHLNDQDVQVQGVSVCCWFRPIGLLLIMYWPCIAWGKREEKNPSSWFKLFHYSDYAKQCTRVGRPECQFFHQHRTGLHCHTQWPAHWILLQNEKFSITISERFYCLPCAWKRRSQPIDPWELIIRICPGRVYPGVSIRLVPRHRGTKEIVKRSVFLRGAMWPLQILHNFALWVCCASRSLSKPLHILSGVSTHSTWHSTMRRKSSRTFEHTWQRTFES